MSWNTDLFWFPRFRDYKAALALYNSIKPIRGSDERRFAKRSQKQFTVQKNDDGKIVFYCHNTPVISVTPKNYIEIMTGGWPTQLTARFVDALLFSPAYKEKNNILLRVKRLRKEGPTSCVAINGNTPTIFKIKNEGELHYVSGGAYRYLDIKIPAKAAKIRKKFKLLLDTARALSKLDDDGYIMRIPEDVHSVTYTMESINNNKITNDDVQNILIDLVYRWGETHYPWSGPRFTSMKYSAFRDKFLKAMYELNDCYKRRQYLFDDERSAILRGVGK